MMVSAPVFLSEAHAEVRCVLPDGEDLPDELTYLKLKKILAGEYLRHSPNYYRWVKDERGARLPTEADALSRSLLAEDLAAAHVRLGETSAAVKALKSGQKLTYRDHLSLGMAFMAAHQFDRAQRYFGDAFEMNPNGAFSPEGFPKHILDYVAIEWGKSRKKVPVAILEERGAALGGFATYLEEVYRQQGQGWGVRQWTEAVNGVGELLLCGFRESSIVWEMLGDLLREAPEGALKQSETLAARAYLGASYATNSLWGRIEYRGLAKGLLDKPTKKRLRRLERVYGKELVKGNQLRKRIAVQEKRWLRKKLDLDEHFERRYLTPGSRS
ncbi:MAG: hypothetical protein VX699_04870 [Myxococcota bacterium]|nr:hypothetical protein [Myxococcota bacterium]